MQFIQGKDRSQSVLFPKSLDQIIGHDHEVRIIDAFISGIDPVSFGFKVKTTFEGRPANDPKYLLKLFGYGFRRVSCVNT